MMRLSNLTHTVAFLTLASLIAFPFAGIIFPPWAHAQDLSTKRPVLAAKPVPLDFRKIVWPSLDYSSETLSGGGSFYSFPSETTRKFSLSLVFRSGVYTLDQNLRPALGAYADLLLEGGTQKQSFESLQRVVSENGLSLSSNLTSQGHLFIKIEGLVSEFDKAFELITEVLSQPAFRETAFETWKRSQISDFEGLIDANSLREQYRLIEPGLIQLTFGKGHYFATFLDRSKPATISAIALDQVKSLHAKVINRSNLVAMLAGGYKPEMLSKVRNFLTSLPKKDPAVPLWLPSRASFDASARGNAQKNVEVLIIRKKDMPQSSIAGRVLLHEIGELNSIEEVELAIAREVFSSTSGVVGEDRFSGALRKKSGLSYSAYAYVDSKATYPNTNDGTWNLIFQTPVEKTAEGIQLAFDTWQEFVKSGVTSEEFSNTRTILMNKMLSQETSALEKSAAVLSLVLKNQIPATNPEQEWLMSLSALESAQQVNTTLKRLTSGESVKVSFALMGGLSDDQIQEIRKLKFVQKVDVTDFEDFIKNYSK